MRKVAALVSAAVLTVVLIVGVWVLRAGGGADAGLPVPRGEATGGDAGPVIGAFMRTVAARLDADPPPVAAITGPVRFRALRVRLPAPGRDFLNTDLVTGALDAGALRAGAIILTAVEVTRPRIAMLRSADGSWNYETPLARLLDDDGDADDGGVERRLTITRLRTIDGVAEIIMPERTVTARALDVDLSSIVLSGPGVAEPSLRVVEGSARLTGLGAAAPDSTLPVRMAAAALRFPDATVAFDADLVVLGDNTLTDVAGVWNPGGPGFGLHATGLASDLRLADVRFLAPDRIPEEGDASFRWSIEPRPAGDTRVTLTDLTARTMGSTMTGSLTLEAGPSGASLPAADLRLAPVSVALLERVAGREMPFTGDVTGQLRGEAGDIRFELAADLVADSGGVPFRTGLTGRVAFGEGRMDLRAFTADLDTVPLTALGPWLPLPLAGSMTGVIEASSTGSGPLQVDVTLDLAEGRVTMAGTVDLTGEAPSYDLAGSLAGIAADALLEGAPPVSVAARVTARGSGTDPRSMRSAFTVSGGFTGWESESGDTIDVALTVADGVLTVRDLGVRLAGLEGEAAGDWRFTEPRSGRLAYEGGFSTLRAWGPYLPAIGDSAAVGTVSARGTLTGTLDALRLEGGLTITAASSGGWAVEELTATYTAGTGEAFTLVTEGTARGVASPTEGEFDTAEFSFSLLRPSVSVTLRAAASDGRVVHLLADGRIPEEGPAEVNVRELRLDVAGGRWTMNQPATVRWGEGSPIEVAGLVLEDASATGRLAVDGVVWPLADAAVRVEIVDLPVADVQRLAGHDPVVTGLLSVAGDVRGPEDAPVVDLTFGLAGGSVEGVALSTVSGELGFADQVVTLNASARLADADTSGVVELRARLPVAFTLSTSPGFRLLETGPVEGELIARALALAPLAPLAPTVRDLQGILDGRVTLGGSSDAPELGGRLVLSDGEVRVPALNQRFTEITGSFDLAERRLVVTELRARSGGTAVLTGNVTFERLGEPSLDLVAYLEGFRPLGVSDRSDAAVSGRLVLSGTLDAPVLGGQVAVSDGYVTIPQFGSDAAFEDLGVAAPVFGQDLGTAPGEGFMARLGVDALVVVVGDGVWFLAEEARAQLAGELTVSKAGDEMRIQGTLEGERGTYTLRAGPVIRRFEVLNAQVRFLGSPEVNPALAITARRLVFDESGRQLEVQVTIGGNLRNPTLGLASADAANIPESELLSFLLFGRPTLELAAGGMAGETLLEATFLELATLQLEQAIVGDLGLALDVFQVRFPGGVRGAASPTVVLGREVATDVFLTVESGLSALFDNETAPSDTWGIRLEWAFDRNSSARLGWEPVTRGRFLRALGSALPVQGPAQQLFVELRRRWVY